MNFYNPMAFIFSLALPAIIILYLLKQKHQDYQVASIRLWQEVLRDIEANAPWQKLRRNLLLFLQLLAMLLLVFALSRPFLNTPGSRAGRVIVVLDTSLSMQATDVKPSRFAAAKRQASRYISNLKPGTLVTLVNMSRSAVLEETLSSDKGRLIEKLDALEPSFASENLQEAGELVKAMLKQQPGTEVVCFGDKPLNIEGIETGFSSVSGKGENFAVAALSHTRTEKAVTVLARIANFSGRDSAVPVSLYTDGRVFDARVVRAAKGETVNVYWNNVPKGTELIECRLDLKDDLEADNRAWNAINRLTERKALLVSRQNIFLEKAVSLIDGMELFKSGFEGVQTKGYDLYIFDGYLPDRLPEDGSSLIFNPPANSVFKTGAVINAPVLKKPEHQLMKYTEEYKYSIGKTKTLTVPEWGESLLESDRGVVAFAGALDNRRLAVFGFDLHATDLAITPAFPIMMANLLEWLAPTDVKNVEALYPGEAVEFNLDPGTTDAAVTTPGGSVLKVAPPFPTETFNNTEEIGKYTLEQKAGSETLKHYFTVNVPSAQESDLLGESSAKAVKGLRGTNRGVESGFSLQNILMWAVLLLICLEWWVYTHGI